MEGRRKGREKDGRGREDRKEGRKNEMKLWVIF